MSESNIVAGSNVFLIRTEQPWWDPEFVAQIDDYQLLKAVEARQADYRVARFSKKQLSIIETDIRCVYAKNDPCWGYSNEKKRVVSACINGNCPKIKECNPNYSSKEGAYWKTTYSEAEAYGKPKRQPRYYFVDMVSDEEMTRYYSNPRNEGFEYSVPRSPVLKDEKDDPSRKSKIDPATGRKMVVVGYDWKITDNASYESEELIPIWGYVEEVEEKKQPVFRKRAKRIEKLEEPRPIKKKTTRTITENSDFERKEEFEKKVSEAVTDEIKLTDVDEEFLEEGNCIILLDNLAELAFVSSTLLVSGIEHGIRSDSGVMLALIDDYEKYSDRQQILISNTTLKSGCKEINVKSWKALSQRTDITNLQIGSHEYYCFVHESINRWTCRNMYGVTHVCIENDDISDIEGLDDGMYPVTLYEDGNVFGISRKNGEVIGHLGKSFVDVIEALKQTGEIDGTIAFIKGLSIRVLNGQVDVLGMGHLKFEEY